MVSLPYKEFIKKPPPRGRNPEVYNINIVELIRAS